MIYLFCLEIQDEGKMSDIRWRQRSLVICELAVPSAVIRASVSPES